MTHAGSIGQQAAPEDQRIVPIVDELKRRGAEAQPHGRSSLLRHLCGTRDILVVWNQPERLRLAGIVHSVYATDAFSPALFDVADREAVRALVGDGAERLAYLFCAIRREDLCAQVRGRSGVVDAPLTLLNRRDDSVLALSRQDVGDLLVLYLANAADQACLADGGPTCWIASAAEVARWAKITAEVAPPILDGCTAVVSRAVEESALVTYDTAVRTLAANPNGAEVALASVSRSMPYLAEPFVWLGVLAASRGDGEAARACGARATERANTWGTAWDKRLTLQQWQMLAARLARVPDRVTGRTPVSEQISSAVALATSSPHGCYEALDEALRQLERPTMVRPARTDTAPQDGGLPPRFRQYVAGLSESAASAGERMYPGLTARPWHDPQRFALATALETAADAIAAELSALTTQFIDEAEDIAREGRWSVAFLSKPGVECDDIRAMCPATTAVLDAHASEMPLAGAAYFSCLDPGTRVAPHRGPTNTRLRCHLGLEVPDHCGLRVGGIEGAWERGRCIVFDDSFVHEVWNLSDRRRVVLIVDVWHPDLSQEEVALLRWITG